MDLGEIVPDPRHPLQSAGVLYRGFVYRAGMRYIHPTLAEGSHNGSAAVLKTAGRKAMQVRVLSPPPLRTKVAGRVSGGLFALPSGVGKCKKIKGLAEGCGESFILPCGVRTHEIQQFPLFA